MLKYCYEVVTKIIRLCTSVWRSIVWLGDLEVKISAFFLSPKLKMWDLLDENWGWTLSYSWGKRGQDDTKWPRTVRGAQCFILTHMGDVCTGRCCPLGDLTHPVNASGASIHYPTIFSDAKEPLFRIWRALPVSVCFLSLICWAHMLLFRCVCVYGLYVCVYIFLRKTIQHPRAFFHEDAGEITTHSWARAIGAISSFRVPRWRHGLSGVGPEENGEWSRSLPATKINYQQPELQHAACSCAAFATTFCVVLLRSTQPFSRSRFQCSLATAPCTFWQWFNVKSYTNEHSLELKRLDDFSLIEASTYFCSITATCCPGEGGSQN